MKLSFLTMSHQRGICRWVSAMAVPCSVLAMGPRLQRRSMRHFIAFHMMVVRCLEFYSSVRHAQPACQQIAKTSGIASSMLGSMPMFRLKPQLSA
eukprot:CAMPEP_0172755536 /NCGR_PEP_ID=MMETSP1074-20121228/160034_1 /TAXON_ID=2916 /ORGANISM="Ceratium fusus, Strain PA161109" /LENGTH=94 /DNA_ID=CAMNT_0013588633 /DNA_START=16 /DNA_END=300 /DNA_ORIENTATION=-